MNIKQRLINVWHDLLRHDNKYLIQKLVDKHRYDLVIDAYNRISMLMGWTDQEEEDYYYILYNYFDHKIRFESCVGGFIYLKHLKKHEYSDLLQTMNRNAFELWFEHNNIDIKTLSEKEKINVNRRLYKWLHNPNVIPLILEKIKKQGIKLL